MHIDSDVPNFVTKVRKDIAESKNIVNFVLVDDQVCAGTKLKRVT